MVRIYPSIISADLTHLAQDIKNIEPYCDGFHLDIMDNHFVPNLTFGIDMIHAIAKITTKQLWIHLMVDTPDTWIEKITLPPNTIISFHIESTINAEKVVLRIKEKKWLASIAINPKTNADEIFSLCHLIDQVLAMSVEPGFSGQHFLESTVAKIPQLMQYKKQHNLSFAIGMDGGIDPENIGLLAQKGVTDFAIASAIFKHDNPILAIEQLRKNTTQ